MSINLPRLSGLLVILTTTAFPVVAVAQMEPQNYKAIPDTFEKAFFRHDRNFYENGSPQRQLDSLFGPGTNSRTTFPENEIARDAELVNTLYSDVMVQQTQNDPYLRTPDLPNPYNSSLLMSPRYNANQLKVGTEYRFDSLMSR
ncbi:MAG: hypothetical protein EAZ77_03455 [Nostocales cyanobacterium]|nr:MAG: hypothetical protein EAZ77_03455 [Nostocales cyanobacterium]